MDYGGPYLLSVDIPLPQIISGFFLPVPPLLVSSLFTRLFSSLNRYVPGNLFNGQKILVYSILLGLAPAWGLIFLSNQGLMRWYILVPRKAVSPSVTFEAKFFQSVRIIILYNYIDYWKFCICYTYITCRCDASSLIRKQRIQLENMRIIRNYKIGRSSFLILVSA